MATFSRNPFTTLQTNTSRISLARPSLILYSRSKPRRLHAITTGNPQPSRRSLLVLAAVKKPMQKHIACSKTLNILPGKEKTVESLCNDIITFTQGRQSDKNNGILSFMCSKDAFESSTFHFWEIYESNIAMGRHNTTPEMKAFMENVQKYLEQPVGMALYEMKDGQIGAVATQGGPKGEGGLDDATGAAGTAGGAGYKQTSSAVDLTNIKEEEKEEDRGLWGIKFEFPWMKKNK